MLICDTHADTLYAMAAEGRPAELPFDVRREHFLDSRDVRVQALALFVFFNVIWPEYRDVPFSIRAFIAGA